MQPAASQPAKRKRRERPPAKKEQKGKRKKGKEGSSDTCFFNLFSLRSFTQACAFIPKALPNHIAHPIVHNGPAKRAKLYKGI